MNAVAIFINVGFYHAARLNATSNLLDKFGWRLTVLQLTDDTLDHPWGYVNPNNTFPLITLSPLVVQSNFKDRIPTFSKDKLETYLADIKPDVVFLPGWSFALSTFTLQWCRRNKVPAVVMSESKKDDKKRIWLKEKIKSFLYIKKFSAALVGGSKHADYLELLGISRDKIFTGYDVVDNEYFQRAADIARNQEANVRNLYPSIPKKPYFLVVTRLIARKNIRRLLAAYLHYKNATSGLPWSLVICGRGDELSQLREMVFQEGMEELILFPGFISYQDIGVWYGLAEAFIHPALEEQWGLVVNEACAAGLPILCSKTVGAQYDLVREKINGFLFDPKDAFSIANSLIQISTTPPQTRKIMGEESRRIIREYSPQKFADGFLRAALVATENNTEYGSK